MLLNKDKIYLKSPIKWSGGKYSLISKIENYLDQNKEVFVELFAGSLALTLYFQPKNVIINDICFPLINMWYIIKKFPNKLCYHLNIFNNNNYNNSKKFYEIRNLFNELKNKKKINKNKKIILAAYFIYLNKRSFNGLYRENKKGEYNSSYRYYKNSNIYDKQNILNISKYFNNNYIKFYNKSFIDIKIPNNSFVYIDPPYYPSKTSSFTSYNKNNFTINQQILLNNYCNLLDKNNIKFLQSNSPCKEIIKLYKNFNYISFFIQRNMRSAIKENNNKKKRKYKNEILIFN